MTIKQFIEKAIEGGWEKERAVLNPNDGTYSNHKMYLDPLVWQAVGKVEKWDEGENVNIKVPAQIVRRIVKGVGVIEVPTKAHVRKRYYKKQDVWKKQMHRMINHLTEGGTIESFIKTL